MKILSIGGSDPSSGAGVQADIRTWSELGAWGLSAITAVTGQNTSRYTRTEAVSAPMVKAQIESVLSDFEIDAVKISMVYSAGIIRAVRDSLKGVGARIVLDPVMVSSTGGRLLEKSALPALRRLLLPVSDVVTPNVGEAQALSGVRIKTRADMGRAAKKILSYGAKSTVITGWPDDRNVQDVLFDDTVTVMSAKRLPSENRGSGGVHSAALTLALAEGMDMAEAAGFAQRHAHDAIQNAQRMGRGMPVVSGDRLQHTLGRAVAEFASNGSFGTLIPECQTNFVYSKKNAGSTGDILGIDGRIVRTQAGPAVAGAIRYGGSRHVASAVMAVQKKFPDISSAINIRYEKRYVAAARRLGMTVLQYDRTKEPSTTRSREGRSVSWGVSAAIRGARSPPDLVYHTGDHGKEPMIIIFGATPRDVLDRVALIAQDNASRHART